MKPSKWTRLGIGLCLFAALMIFQGTLSHETKCVLCLLDEGATGGYLEIHNNTIYNIVVSMHSKQGYVGPYKITGNPTFLRKYLANGTYRVRVSICTPTPSQTPVYYKNYVVSVPDEYQTISLTVTTPLGYIPVPK